MATAGLIVNPASGKDIRRLVSHGSVFDNQEKVRITRRLLMGLETAGVTRVLYMPDAYTLVLNALESVRTEMAVAPVEMPITTSQDDSTLAATLMEKAGVDVILVLGGDGTSRAVYKGTRCTPLLPISTGTNNVFPTMVEATVAGLAAGLVASRRFSLEQTCYRASTLDVCINGHPADCALVDVAVYDDIFLGSRAVWDLDRVPQLFLSRCRPDVIGLSSIGGQLVSIKPEEPRGLALDICPPTPGIPVVTAAIAPGLFVKIGIQRRTEMLPEQDYPVSLAPCLLAVDGEREVEVGENDRASVRLNTQGVLVVDMPRVMEHARQAGIFVA